MISDSCHCLQNNISIPVYNPRWICLMPNKINEIMIGPLGPLEADCFLEVKESPTNTFRIINKYVYPNFLTHMITLSLITPTADIIKPGDLLASLGLITSERFLKEINGKKNMVCLCLIYFLFFVFLF
jgi:hypothetical protein